MAGPQPAGTDHDQPLLRRRQECIDVAREHGTGGECDRADHRQFGCVLAGDLAGEQCCCAALRVPGDDDVVDRADAGQSSEGADAVEYGACLGLTFRVRRHAGGSEPGVVGCHQNGPALDLQATIRRQVVANGT